ncbi:MAG: polysaccharide pyruvyl transferase CsaB [Peptococcaceae bacterium]|nr:polysaccharide pyruvyl transferase CsaB [Peptococcaceae bacterium]MBR2010044.1 polysaccharide pyruvyl transferase CsaB [Peptococcaceae bacterium]
MRVLLSGYYGFDNAGDEAVLYAIVQALRAEKPDIDITVLSNQPEHTSEQFGVKSVNRWGKIALLKAVKNCDVFISGGGSLLQDVTSKNGILYYLGLIKLAQVMKKKVMIYAQGIGPVHNGRNRALVRKILNKVNVITVRDLESRMELMQMGVYREIMVCADPVLGIPADEVDAKIGKTLLEKGGVENYTRPILMVAARSWQNSGDLFEEIAAFCDDAVQNGWQIVFLPFHYPEDIETGKMIAAKMQHVQDVTVLQENYTPLETMHILKNADMILGMRLHSLIMGATLQKPMIALSYDPKVSSFMQLLRQRECYGVRDVTAQQLIMAMQRLKNRSDKETAQQAMLTEIMTRQAKEPIELLMQLF